MRHMAIKVGELARRTGVTVRTLHYYDELGLLAPSHHTDAGHRLYADDDVARLQQIKSLRHLGFSLEEIRECLSRPDFSPQQLVELHLQRVREQIELQQRLYERLEVLAENLRAAAEVSVEAFIQAIGAISMFEKYFTPQQLDEIRARKEIVGEERIRQVEAEWPELIALVRAEMDKGTDPTGAAARQLARRWMGLVDEFTGGNPAIERSLRTMYQREPQIGQQYASGLDPKMLEYIGKAMAAVKEAG
jgi:DNA-binding transcriptional MerR regulator